MDYIKALFSVNKNASLTRVMAFMCCMTAIIIAFMTVNKDNPDFSGAILMSSGITTGTAESHSGSVTIKSGDISGTGTSSTSGQVTLASGNTGSSGNQQSGGVSLQTGDSGYQSGDILIQTGAGTVDDTAYSGGVTLATGNVTGTAPSGHIRLVTGTVGTGEQGHISFESLYAILPLGSADPAGAPEGSLYYNTSTHAIKIYNGTTWQTVTAV